MKIFGKIMKVLVALAAIAGAIYVFATYGDKIVTWSKKMLNKVRCCCNADCCEEIVVEATEAEEIPQEEPAVQAEENDFEG